MSGVVPRYTKSAAAVSASASIAAAATRRRSKRSATEPVTSTRSAAGAKDARPRRPRSSGRPLIANTWIPSTVSRAADAIALVRKLARSATTERWECKRPF